MFGFQKVPHVTRLAERNRNELYAAAGVAAGDVNLVAATKIGVPASGVTEPYKGHQAAIFYSRSAAEAEAALEAACGDFIPVPQRDLERMIVQYERR